METVGKFSLLTPLVVMLCAPTTAAQSNGGVEHIETNLVLQHDEVKTLQLDNGAATHTFEMSVAIASNRNSNGMGKTAWNFDWRNEAGNSIVTVTVKWGNDCLGDPLDRRFMLVTADSHNTDGTLYNVLQTKCYDGIDLYSGANTLSIEVNHSVAKMWIGRDYQYYLGEFHVPNGATSVAISGNKKLKIGYLAYRSEVDKAHLLQTEWNWESLTAHMANAVGCEGLWEFLDRDTNTKIALPGGFYKLAVVKHTPSPTTDSSKATDNETTHLLDGKTPIYDIIYISGAQENATSWQTGMLKGRLYPTIFVNHFALEWFDAHMERITDEISADITDNAILQLNFPIYQAQMRFSRVAK